MTRNGIEFRVKPQELTFDGQNVRVRGCITLGEFEHEFDIELDLPILKSYNTTVETLMYEAGIASLMEELHGDVTSGEK